MMRYMIVGFFDRYGDAEDAVADLEQAGIVGHQVEVISDLDEDARTADTPNEPATKPQEHHTSRLAKLFGAGGALENRDVRDESGDQPDYIGEQEFYATHVKQGGAVMIVRIPSEELGSRAAAILRDHGARTPGSKDAPIVRQINEASASA
jgi:hypothetical protein